MTKLIQIDFNQASFSVVEVEDSLLVPASEGASPMLYEMGGVIQHEDGLGFADNVRHVPYSEEALRKLEELKATTIYIKEAGDSYDEDGCPTGDWTSWNNQTDLLTFFLNTFWEFEMGWDRKAGSFLDSLFDPNLLGNLDQVRRDCTEYHIGVYTEEQLKAEEAEKKRLKIERTASWWAKQCGYPVGSREYVLSAKRALDDREEAMEEDFNYERRAERFAACRYAGCPDSYWSDEDYIRGKHLDGIEEVGMVLQWLEENCPLLMRQLEEAELATQED